MVFGDGDGEFFNRFTISLDVIGHELTHGVTQFTNGLEYQDQSGALNESMSDVFGSLVKQRALGQDAASADWLIGAGIFTSNVNGRALRDMVNPGTAYDDPNFGRDPQPGNMRGYVQTQDDNGGVHINSGIPNRAFALTAQAIGGNAWEDAGLIWYKAMQMLTPKSQFQDAADTTVAVAGQEFGANSTQQQAVVDAWAQVGLKVSVSGGGRAPCPSTRNGNGSALVQRVERIAADLKRLTEVVNQSMSRQHAAKEYAGRK
jgi:Zn-dependent metalloprotease